jgi:hypothetical protein
MIREDARSRRAVIVADYLVNPGSALYAGLAGLAGRPGPVLDVLVDDGWGMMKPPPHILGEAVGSPAVTNMAGDAVDYRRHDYAVVILAVEGLPQGGVWLDLFEAAFRELGAPMPAVAHLRLDGAEGSCTAAGVRAALAAAAAVTTAAISAA